MNATRKMKIINKTIDRLNDHIKHHNKIKVEQKCYNEQTPLHGADMFFTLCFKSDKQLEHLERLIK